MKIQKLYTKKGRSDLLRAVKLTVFNKHITTATVKHLVLLSTISLYSKVGGDNATYLDICGGVYKNRYFRHG